LTRGSDERIHLLHQELHGLLCVLALQRLHAGDETRVAEFLAIVVEGVDHPVGKKEKQVAGG